MRYTNNKTGKFIEVGYLPEFERKCLLVGKGDKIYKVGSFISEECAKQFEEYLRDILGDKVDNLWQY